jgi:hypothetical protein
MIKIDRFTYHVASQENVSVAITPSVNLGNLYTANLDAHAMAKPPSGIYLFTVTRPVGKTHFMLIDFDFTGAPAGSQYRIEIDGDAAGNLGPFTVTVRIADPMPLKTFQFKVV